MQLTTHFIMLLATNIYSIELQTFPAPEACTNPDLGVEDFRFNPLFSGLQQ